MSGSIKINLAKRSIRTAGFAIVLLVVGLVLRRPLLVWFFGERAPAAATVAMASESDGVDHYTCSMHPTVKQHDPGKCPICGMDLVSVTKLQQAQGVVMIDQARRQLIGVRTEAVTEGPMQRSFRALGHVAYDESTLTDVNLKVRGWITKLLVNQTGQRVSKGQTLFLFYSPELYNAEQDYLLANQSHTSLGKADSDPSPGGMLAKAAAQRLHLLGLNDAQLAALQKSGVPSENIAIPSPASGFVIEKQVVEGASVDAGMRLYRIAALDRVWVEADVYEGDLAHVRVGQAASVTLDYAPGQSYDAKVAYIYPSVDPSSRTGRVRVELGNKALELRPGMYASVTLRSDAAPRVQVPASAVVYTGPRRLVFVDLGDGRFRPQEIQVGDEANGAYEVLSGLKSGDVVATSGVFLIAAEARISTAAKYWDNSAQGQELDTVDGGGPNLPMAAPSDSAPRSMPATVKRTPKAAASASASSAPSLGVFSCPMHPEVRSATAGTCPKCGMQLQPAPPEAAK